MVVRVFVGFVGCLSACARNQLIYFWFGFVFANIPWLTLPLRLLLLAMQAATEEAELAGMAKNEKVKDN